MVDYADTNSQDFNDNIMEIIMDFNWNPWFLYIYKEKHKISKKNTCIIFSNLIWYISLR
jgi:hypothetical protein